MQSLTFNVPAPAYLSYPRMTPPSSPSDLSKYSFSSSNANTKQQAGKIKLPSLQSILNSAMNPKKDFHQTAFPSPTLSVQPMINQAPAPAPVSAPIQQQGYPYSPLPSRCTSSSSINEAPCASSVFHPQPTLQQPVRPPMLKLSPLSYPAPMFSPSTPSRLSPLPAHPQQQQQQQQQQQAYAQIPQQHTMPMMQQQAMHQQMVPVRGGNNQFINSKKKRTNLPKKTTVILLNWLNDNLDHPYPNSKEKLELIRRTGLTNQQLSNWFINARRRKIQLLRNIKSNSHQL
ncbi:unnamed protein product [Ambrosiozyma monospora]|uniref:Unnamed protein product n=1 Tax=Ambrosiozyma monospora TaxID=43982 RepID=A0A9W6Z487_AMBMO|nr:unnamed protein product [Ambrosiozyma monospora]